jgi:hypothetical protein
MALKPDPFIEVVGVSAPPAGQPVFWRADPGDQNRLLATDYNGGTIGFLRFSQPVFGGIASADGSRLLIKSEVVSAAGQVIGYPVPYGMWADDNRHLCAVRAANGGWGGPFWKQVSPGHRVGFPPQPAWLFLIDPGGSARRVAQVGLLEEEGGAGVLACSPAHDRVVTAQSRMGDAFDLAVYRLSTGERLYQAGPGTRFPNVTASHDGRLVAVDDPPCHCLRILELPSGRVVGTLRGAEFGYFSWNGSLLADTVSVRDWRRGRLVWSHVPVPYPRIIGPRPGTNDFLFGIGSIELSRTQPNNNDFFDDVWLVPEHGPARLLLQHALWVG